jgi:hypothetical protein
MGYCSSVHMGIIEVSGTVAIVDGEKVTDDAYSQTFNILESRKKF